MSDEKRRQDIALFRYGLIAPVLHGTHPGCAAEYFRQATAAPLEVPQVGPTKLRPDTLKAWLQDFRASGLDGLMPRPRSDLGSFRAVPTETGERLLQLLSQHPLMSATVARERLVEEGLICSPSPSETTLRRFIRMNGLRAKPAAPDKARHPWSKEDPNEMWILDFLHGPSLTGCKLTPRLVAAIDDASRFVVLGRFLGSESYSDLAPCLVDAFSRHGLPLAIYCDNGAAFSTRDLALACARLDIALIHSKPYVPQGRGKVERFFLTVRTRFLAALDPGALVSLEALDAAFQRWLDTDYHRRVHSTLGVTPLERFLDSKRPRRWISRQQLDLHFHRTLHRKVKADCTVSVNGVRYEVSPDWVGRKVELRSPLDDPDTFTLFAGGQPALTLKPLDPVDNDRANRRAHFADTRKDQP